MSKRFYLPLLAVLTAGCASGTQSVYKGSYPVMLGPKDRVRATPPLPTTVLGEYRGGTYRESNSDGTNSSASHNSSLEVEADKLINDDPANDIRVDRIEAEAWATIFVAAVSAQVVVHGQAVKTGGK